jgi:hypothetical protein
MRALTAAMQVRQHCAHLGEVSITLVLAELLLAKELVSPDSSGYRAAESCLQSSW